MVLISRSEVRYEGTIAHVDAATASVKLAHAYADLRLEPQTSRRA